MVECILVYLNMVGLTLQINLISPLCDDKSFTTTAHVQFQCETFDNHFDCHFIFFNFQKRTLTSSGNVYLLKISMLVADNKAYRALRILYVNCMLKAEFL